MLLGWLHLHVKIKALYLYGITKNVRSSKCSSNVPSCRWNLYFEPLSTACPQTIRTAGASSDTSSTYYFSKSTQYLKKITTFAYIFRRLKSLGVTEPWKWRKTEMDSVMRLALAKKRALCSSVWSGFT